jgi:hypothetical protein
MSDLPPVGDFARALLALESDPAFVRLSASQSRTNLFRILGTDERERWHSAFWAWLLDPEGSHGLRDLPIRRLLVRAFDRGTGALRARLLVPEMDDDEVVRWTTVSEEDAASRMSLADVLALEVRSAIAAPGPRTGFSEVTSRAGSANGTLKGDEGRFDILVFLEGPHPRFPDGGPLTMVIIVEVKVNDSYKPLQLARYSQWLHCGPSPAALLPSAQNGGFLRRAAEMIADAAAAEGAPGVWGVGLFLCRPDAPLGATPPEKLSPPWSTVTFAHLIQEVLEPALQHPELDPHARPLLQAYLDLAAHPSMQVLDMPASEHQELAFRLLQRHGDTFRILASVLEKASSNDEVNQIGANIREALESGGRDITRYDVRVGDVVYPRLSKRNAIYRVFRAVVEEGASVAALAETPELRPALLGLDGKLDRATFIERATAVRRSFPTSRWFAAEDQIVHQGGRSWVLSNQWGRNGQDAMQRLLASVPGTKVRVDPSAA